MIIIVGLFGAFACIASFICSIICFIGGQIGLGFATFLSALYCLAVTVVLIRTDGKATDAENKIKSLEDQISKIKEQMGFDETKAEPEVEEPGEGKT